MNTRISLSPFHELLAEQESEFRRLSPARTQAERRLPSMLESKGIKVTYRDIAEEYQDKKTEDLFQRLKEEQENEEKEFFIKGIADTCKRWLCPECRRIKGLALRHEILKRSALFIEPKLYTITVFREWFDDNPEKSYDYVMKEKFIARLLTKEMGVRRWLWVLEFQEENGNGWPHWHMLIDVGDLPGQWYNKSSKKSLKKRPDKLDGWQYIPHFFDLNRVHRLLSKWKVGKQCRLSEKKSSFESPEHAINYITKYLIKTPERGFPVWALKHKNLRFYQPSKDIGAFSTDTKKTASKKKTLSSARRLIRTPVEAVSECRSKVMFVVYSKSKDRHFVSAPMYGLKESIPLFQGSVSVEDFDFEAQKSFPLIGFKNFSDVIRFQNTWQKTSLLLKLGEFISEKEKFLLGQWDSMPHSGGQTSGAGEAVKPRNTADRPKEISFFQPPHFDRRSNAKTEAEGTGLSVAV